MGNVLQAGLGQNTCRQASMKEGLPIDIPSFTICYSIIHWSSFGKVLKDNRCKVTPTAIKNNISLTHGIAIKKIAEYPMVIHNKLIDSTLVFLEIDLFSLKFLI